MRDAARIVTGRFTVEGTSRAGNETWFRVKELGISLDIGRCPDPLISLPHIFVTHSHLDHALGIPFYAAQRRLRGLDVGNVYVPAESLEGFRELMRVHESLENTDYPLNLIGMKPGDVVSLRRGLSVRAHRSPHRVAAVGYEFLERRAHLAEEFRGRSGEELAGRRAAGEPIVTEEEVPLLFYTGDTDRRIFEVSPAVFRAELLMIECSFTGAGERDRAELYAHIHIEDLYERAADFKNEVIVLTHFSLRDRPETIHRRIIESCPAVLRPRIRLALPEPFDRL